MTIELLIERAGPLCTIQDHGRPGLLMHGISASGPMDRAAHALAGALAGAASAGGIEVTRAGMDLRIIQGDMRIGWAGGDFIVRHNETVLPWPGSTMLASGDRLSVTPGASGNYGYLRFGHGLDLPMVLGSQSTNTRARLGGMAGRALVAGDVLTFSGKPGTPKSGAIPLGGDGPVRFVWGLHAEHFTPALRHRFVGTAFRISPMMDRMGVRLADEGGVFAHASVLSLVSDPLLAGDIQILGDGTPIVLMRDHQPTGGYPRIGTVISADLDRFAQMRAGAQLAFAPISVEHAQMLMRSGQT